MYRCSYIITAFEVTTNTTQGAKQSQIIDKCVNTTNAKTMLSIYVCDYSVMPRAVHGMDSPIILKWLQNIEIAFHAIINFMISYVYIATVYVY